MTYDTARVNGVDCEKIDLVLLRKRNWVRDYLSPIIEMSGVEMRPHYSY